MALDVAAICAESAQKESSSNTAIIFGILFCVYIFFDVLLGFLTIGMKTLGPITTKEDTTASENYKGILKNVSGRF